MKYYSVITAIGVASLNTNNPVLQSFILGSNRGQQNLTCVRSFVVDLFDQTGSNMTKEVSDLRQVSGRGTNLFKSFGTFVHARFLQKRVLDTLGWVQVGFLVQNTG